MVLNEKGHLARNLLRLANVLVAETEEGTVPYVTAHLKGGKS